MKNIEMILCLTESVKDSLERYEYAAEIQNRKPPSIGYDGLDAADSKESIQRRITVIRAELLKLSKSL